jgi:hypothetical protein
MGNLRGALSVQISGADGVEKNLTLFFGMSAIEAISEKHGDSFLDSLSGESSVPFGIVLDIFRESLKRFHAAELSEDPYLVDDLIAQDGRALEKLLDAAFPDLKAKAAVGNGRKARAKPK